MGLVSPETADLPPSHSDQARGRERTPRASRCGLSALMLVAAALAAMFVLPVTAPAQTPESGRMSLVKPWDSFFSVAFLPSGK
jgi:hypothetical protein